MWKLFYEDTFAFGDEREPPKIEAEGNDIAEGFLKLWEAVISESVSGTKEKPAIGFASFMLVLSNHNFTGIEISIDVNKYLNILSSIKFSANPDCIKEAAFKHYKAFTKNCIPRFWEEIEKE